MTIPEPRPAYKQGKRSRQDSRPQRQSSLQISLLRSSIPILGSNPGQATYTPRPELFAGLLWLQARISPASSTVDIPFHLMP